MLSVFGIAVVDTPVHINRVLREAVLVVIRYEIETYTLDAGGKCTLWKSKFGDLEQAAGECGFKKNAQGAEVFFHKGSNEGEFAIEGDAILSDASLETEGAADHAAAKALRDTKEAAK